MWPRAARLNGMSGAKASLRFRDGLAAGFGVNAEYMAAVAAGTDVLALICVDEFRGSGKFGEGC